MHRHQQLPNRDFLRFATRVAVLFTVALVADSAFAQQMVGQGLLTFAGNYVIAPLGIFAVVIALGGGFFRPDLLKGGIYAAVICAVLFFIIRSAPALTVALKN